MRQVGINVISTNISNGIIELFISNIHGKHGVNRDTKYKMISIGYTPVSDLLIRERGYIRTNLGRRFKYKFGL